MKNIHIIPFLAGSLLLAACSKEDNFKPDSRSEGQFAKAALSMEVKADALSKTRAVPDVDVNQFTVSFYKKGDNQPYTKYTYGEMPEIVTLPAGVYTCSATYGENRPAEWECPRFEGSSEEFQVNAYEITSYIDPIVCTLQNVMVTVEFDASLRAAMSADSRVEVKVGESASLNYGIAEADAKKAGYFQHGSEVSLVAVFYGNINGVQTVETKSLANVSKGCHYNIIFRLHNGGGADGTGDADADVNVDATVTITDVTRDVPLPEETLLDDSERPKEDNDDPKPPVPGGDAPAILLNGGEVESTPYDGASMTQCVLTMKSVADGGFTTFVCNIHSEMLEPALPGMGIPTHIDLAHPEMMELQEGQKVEDVLATLQGLGFPTDVAGKKNAEINLTSFIGLMGALGAGEHSFELIVGDANGQTTRTLTLKFN